MDAYKKQTNRVAETILGVLGSIFGIFGGLFAIVFDGLDATFNNTNGSEITGLGVSVILVCIVTLILSFIINKKRVVMGILLVIGGILNFVLISFFGVLSGILILVAGILALIRK